MNAHEAVRVDYSCLHEGCSTRGLCPACMGGTTHERSLSITRDFGVLRYICHRASCGFRGTTDSRGPIAASSKRPHKRYEGSPVPLTAQQVEFFCEKFFLTPGIVFSQGFMFDEKAKRVVKPVFDYVGNTAGTILRNYKELSGLKQLPKSLTYKAEGFDDYAMMHFPVQTRSDKESHILLVEDQMSAIRASEYQFCAALLGTHVSMQHVTYLQRIGVTGVTLALDADATAKSIKIKRQYGLCFRNFNILELSKDIKDMKPDALKEIMV